MKGDFTRDTFDPAKHFSRVLMQQGRVQLDADWNEQAAILRHYLETLAADLIGPHGGPAGDEYGFEIKPDGKAFVIGKGRYYVDGILCENESPRAYSEQRDYPIMPNDPTLDLAKLLSDSGNHVAYLDVWERHMTHLDDQHMREVALGGPDTATRAKVVWQVKLIPAGSCGEAYELLMAKSELSHKGRMQAQLKQENIDPDPCITAPDSKYRGAENQFYRVEIHHNASTDEKGNKTPWTFKWSRENGSIVAAWLGTNEDGGLIVSSTRGFEAEGWVEITSDINELYNTPGRLTKIVKVEGDALYLDQGPDTEWDKDILVKFRSWDQREVGDVVLFEGGVVPNTDIKDPWTDLEDGIQVRFEPDQEYRSGDYWFFPARVATGQIEWPHELDANEKETETPKALYPHGIQHHYAPLAVLNWEGSVIANDCRHPFDSLPTHGT